MLLCCQVLKFEAERQPSRLGSSVLGYNDAFAKLHPVLRQWRAKRAGCAGAAPVPYLVSADVSRAFDHVNADKLIDIVEPMLRSQEYLIIKHVEVNTFPSLPCGHVALFSCISCLAWIFNVNELDGCTFHTLYWVHTVVVHAQDHTPGTP